MYIYAKYIYLKISDCLDEVVAKTIKWDGAKREYIYIRPLKGLNYSPK